MTDYSKMSDFEINKSVAEHESVRGFHCENIGDGSPLRFQNWKELDYCNNPADAWPIITKRRISLSPFDDFKEDGDYIAAKYKPTRDNTKPAEVEFWCCDKPLRAAMIVFLMMQETENV